MQLQLIEKKQEAPDTFSYYFRPDVPVIWKPGQFLRYRIPEVTTDDRGENRFFSIASAPFENHIQLTTKFAPEKGSVFKGDLQKLEAGQSVEAMGPSGKFSMDDPDLNYVFIAGGIGVTPFRAILLDLDHNGLPLNVSLFYANRTTNAIFRKEFEELAKKHPEFKLYYYVSEEQVVDENLTENVRVVPGQIDKKALETLVPNFQSAVYYISGPEPMVLGFESVISGLGVSQENIKRDYFPGYENY